MLLHFVIEPNLIRHEGVISMPPIVESFTFVSSRPMQFQTSSANADSNLAAPSQLTYGKIPLLVCLYMELCMCVWM